LRNIFDFVIIFVTLPRTFGYYAQKIVVFSPKLPE